MDEEFRLLACEASKTEKESEGSQVGRLVLELDLRQWSFSRLFRVYQWVWLLGFLRVNFASPPGLNLRSLIVRPVRRSEYGGDWSWIWCLGRRGIWQGWRDWLTGMRVGKIYGPSAFELLSKEFLSRHKNSRRRQKVYVRTNQRPNIHVYVCIYVYWYDTLCFNLVQCNPRQSKCFSFIPYIDSFENRARPSRPVQRGLAT